MTRKSFIERLLRNIFGGHPPDDSQITANLVNSYLNSGAALALQQAYNNSIRFDGVAGLNSSFFATFSDLSISEDLSDFQTYKMSLPHIPVGIGRVDAISAVRFKSIDGKISLPGTILNQDQAAYADNLRMIPNTVYCIPEGKFIKIKSAALMTTMKGIVTVASPGIPTDLSAEFNVPPDYEPVIEAYVKSQLIEERARKKDSANDGVDAP